VSDEAKQTVVAARTQQLLDGPLKHIRTAALAAALLPLASVAASPAAAQTTSQCASGGVDVCGIVWDDTNHDGIRDESEPGLEGVKVYICEACDGSDTIQTETGPGGYYEVIEYEPLGPFQIAVLIPPGTQVSPTDAGGDDQFDSDGQEDGKGYTVVVLNTTGYPSDFGLFQSTRPQPGTGTPGYWKNHSAAWPVQSITVGGITYSKAQAIALLGKVGKDKSITMFSSLVPAMLNVMVGNDDSCVSSTIAAANLWMAAHPAGSGVAGGSVAWAEGELLHIQMDSYNNGLLCAPHRN
jgi:hypothetical protein